MHIASWVRDSLACPTPRERPLASRVRFSGEPWKVSAPYSTQTYYACVIYLFKTKELIEYQDQLTPKERFLKVGSGWVSSTSGFARLQDLSLQIVIEKTGGLSYDLMDTLFNVEELGCPSLLIVYETALEKTLKKTLQKIFKSKVFKLVQTVSILSENRPRRIIQQGDWECGYLSALQIVFYNPYLWDGHKEVLPSDLLDLLIRLRGGESCLQQVLNTLGIKGGGEPSAVTDVIIKIESYSKAKDLRVPGMLDMDGKAKLIGDLPLFERAFGFDTYNTKTRHNMVTNSTAEIFRYTPTFNVSQNLNIWGVKNDKADETGLKLAMYVISTLNHFAAILCDAPWKTEDEPVHISSLDSNKRPAFTGTLDIIAFYTRGVEKPDWSESVVWEPRILDKQHDSLNYQPLE